MSETEDIQLNLKWDNFSSHLALSFDSCYESQQFVDVSLVCKDGGVIKAHKVILANTSKFFHRLLTENEHPHPMIVMHHIDVDDLRSLMSFMYCGEVQVFQNDLKRLLDLADSLEISGLQQIPDSDNDRTRCGNKNFGAPTVVNDRAECPNNFNLPESPERDVDKPASNLLKYVSTLGQKNLDNPVPIFESSSKKLQEMAQKIESSSLGRETFTDGSKNRTREITNDNVPKTFNRLPENESESLSCKSSIRKLQELAKLLDNVNRNPTLPEMSKATSVGQKRSLHSVENASLSAKKSNVTLVTPSTSETEPEAESNGLVPAHDPGDTGQTNDGEQFIQNGAALIKDEIEVVTDCSTPPDIELDNLHNENSAVNDGENSGTSMLAAELLKAVANKRKGSPRAGYTRKPNFEKQSWDGSLAAIRKKKLGANNAVKHFKAIISSRHVTGICAKQHVNGNKNLTPDLGDKLPGYSLSMGSKDRNSSQKEVRRMQTSSLADERGIECPIRRTKVERILLDRFREQNCERVYDSTSRYVDLFFDTLEGEYRTNHYTADRIFSVNGTGLIVDRNEPAVKIMSCRGNQRFAALKPKQRSSLVTVVCAMSAGGKFIPPMMIFPREKIVGNILTETSAVSSECDISGWIQPHHFTEWLRHFIKQTNPSAESPILLIVDGHYTYATNMDTVKYAKKNHVFILFIPPYTAHKLLPLDLTFMSVLIPSYGRQLQQWLQHSLRPLCRSDIGELFGKAYAQCLSKKVAIDGFKAAGIYPYNRKTLTNEDRIFIRFITQETMCNPESFIRPNATQDISPSTVTAVHPTNLYRACEKDLSKAGPGSNPVELEDIFIIPDDITSVVNPDEFTSITCDR